MKARENPFRSSEVERLRYRASGFCWEKLERRLHHLGGRGAIIGPEGHGKTTLLLEWKARRKAAGQTPLGLRLRAGQRRLTAPERARLRDACAIFVDSAEQLGTPGWWEFLWITRRAETVVITTHRPGRLRTVHFCKTSPALLEELTRELGPTPVDGTELWTRHRGNLRNVFRELYDACSRQRPADATCPNSNGLFRNHPG